jgi:3'(2'), 5'-bisphosphate nucleotidase
MDLQKALTTAREAALDAARHILRIYDAGPVAAQHKEDGSPLTQADLAANAAIVERLRADFPDCPILTEEEADHLGRLDSEWVWIVDPLDGTKEFLARNGEFTVNIALAYQGNPVLGVVGVPVTDTLYYAARGMGAWKVTGGGEPERLHVSSRTRREEMVLVVSRSHAGGKIAKLVEQYPFAALLARGSSLKGCLIASGDADVYYRLGPTNEWDICAMHAVLLEAGGCLTDLHGQPMRYNQPKTLNAGFVVSNNTVHAHLLDLLREAGLLSRS